MIDMLLSILRIRRLPAWAWATIGAIVFTALGAFLVSTTVERIRRDERRRVLAEGAAVESTVLQWQREAAQRQLDSVRQELQTLSDTVSRRVRVVYRWAPLIPDSLRKKYPPVDSLVQVCTRLAKDCDSLRVVAARVDTVRETVTKIDSSRIHALRMIAVARGDSVNALKHRPRWRTALAWVATAGVVGYFGGRR